MELLQQAVNVLELNKTEWNINKPNKKKLVFSLVNYPDFLLILTPKNELLKIQESSDSTS